MEWMLTGEELYAESIEEADYCALIVKIGNRAAQAQARKLVKWLEELCDATATHPAMVERIGCNDCMIELHRQLGLD